MTKAKIIFEDDEILILDKPAGWIVNEAKTTKNIPIVQTWLKGNYNFETAKSRKYRSGIVHRLDKETSGVLIIAKTRSIFRSLQGQFKQRKVKKTYTALVHGLVEPKKGVINAPVGRLPWNRERFGVLPGGREAETAYEAMSNFSPSQRLSKAGGKYQMINEAFTLLELYPKTGRTHQIRIHLKYLGHPIVADEFYAGRKTARCDRKWCPRLFLHASEILFKHPKTGKVVTFYSKLPKDLELSINRLKKIKA